MKRTRRSGLLWALWLILPLALTGCQGEAEAKNPPPAELAAALMEGLEFDDQPEQVDQDAAMTVLGLDGWQDKTEDCAAYMGSGATPEQIVVLRAADEESAQQMAQSLEQSYLRQLKDSFADYAPAETPKIEDARLEPRGRTVALCVCPDGEAAQTILDKEL